MKILDKYVAKNFLIGYVIAFGVLIGLRIVIDVFVNLDEFTQHADLGALAVIQNIATYYSLNTTLYFRDFAGMITVVAAAFSLGKMVRNNELIAMMSSGVSLKRVITPIIVLALVFTGLLVADQELIIPALSDKLVREQGEVPGQESYKVWFIDDGNGSLICSQKFEVATSTLYQPTIILRRRVPKQSIWEVTGQISADKAVYNDKTHRWDFTNGRYVERGSLTGIQKAVSYVTDIMPKDIPVRCSSEHKALLSSAQLSALVRQGTKIKDQAQLYSQKHFRVTDPLINLVMLMISLPTLVCRDPRLMKSAIMISFATTAACFVTAFLCKMFAGEYIFNRVMPEFWAWLPVFIFLPIALLELDSMKT